VSTDTEERKLAAIMFTDMVGYSALSQRDEKLAQELLEEHRQLLREIFPRFHGTEIKTIGDAFLVEFNSALEAARCSIEIQRTLAHRDADAPADRQIQVRIGIHIGDVVHRGGDVYGDGVNIASRIEPLASPGGICLSMDVERQIRNAVETRFEKLAPTELKNISVPMELFRIVLPWERETRLSPDREKGDVRQRRSIPVGWIAALALVAILAAGAAYYFTAHRAATKTAAIPEKSIAVLPLVNSTGDPANEYFSDGMSEEFISSLSRLQELKVVGRTSSFQFKGKSDDSKTIGEKLGVYYLLEGSVRKSADRVRIAVALIKSGDGANVWSETYDRELKDIFAVQSEIAGAVAKELKVALLGHNGQAAQLATAATPSNQNVEAYNALLQGNFYYNRRTAEDYRKAIGYYEEAIRLDPRYALAYALLSRAALNLGTGYGNLATKEQEETIAKARASAKSALALDPNLADAHSSQGRILSDVDFNFAEAEAEYRHALELAPQNPAVTANLASLMSTLGRLDEAVALQQRAIALDPLRSASHFNLSLYLTGLGRYDDAEAALRKVIALQPQSSQNYYRLAEIQILRGNSGAAVELAKQETDPGWRTFGMALAHFANGDRAEADAALKKLIDEDADDAGSQIAQVYALRKEPEKMFEWLEHAWTTHDSGVNELLSDPFLRAYKDDPRYIAFAQKVGVMPKDR
jgi:TolB-like protein/class 3 adenylate cyclase/Tfp pilus assembly protein PilF